MGDVLETFLGHNVMSEHEMEEFLYYMYAAFVMGGDVGVAHDRWRRNLRQDKKRKALLPTRPPVEKILKSCAESSARLTAEHLSRVFPGLMVIIMKGFLRTLSSILSREGGISCEDHKIHHRTHINELSHVGIGGILR